MIELMGPLMKNTFLTIKMLSNRQALESYDLVKLRTTELERMHTTSMLLRQLRHFFNCKAQLEHLLNAAGDVGGIKGNH